MERYDIAVIGAGPAGSTFARLAAKSRLRILIVDGQTSARRKPCGGLLAPDAQTALAEMELTLPASVMVDPQIFSVKTLDLRGGLVRYYPRRYLNMDRLAFDRWLLSLVPESVDVIHGRCSAIVRNDSEFVLSVSAEEEERTVYAAVVVGADGADSLVRRTFYGGYGGRRAIKRYSAILEWFDADGDAPFYSCIFDEATSPAYSFSAFKNDRLLFGGMFEPKGCRAAFEEQKKKLSSREDYEMLLSPPLLTEACLVCRPRRMSDFITGTHGAYLIGEAAGFVSPSSFEGISYALRSGRALAEAVCSSWDGDLAARYRKNTRSLRLKLMLKCVKRIAMYEPHLRKLALRSNLFALKVKANNH